MEKFLLAFSNWLWGFVSSVPRIIGVGAGIVWAYLEPTLPYASICVFSVLIDCLSAWRLNRRVRAAYPNADADGKLKSSRMSKMIHDLVMVYLCILLATELDMRILDFLGDLHLGQEVAAVFIIRTFISILENESSCNGSAWAKLLQKVLVDKTSRHIKLAVDEIKEAITDNDKPQS